LKSIETLVDDIYGLFTDKEFAPSSDQVAAFGQRLATHLSNRIGEQRGSPTLRLSNLGTPCSRKLWYSINTPAEAEELPAPTRVKFLFGDILEELLLFLAEQAGHTVEGQQDELEIEGVKGHRDAIIDGRLVDVKSASSRSFDKFASGQIHSDDPFGYLTQINSYLFASRDDPRLAENRDVASFLVIDKTLGNICLATVGEDGQDYTQLVRDKRELLSQPEPPPRPYTDKPEGKSGNRKLGTVCSYCDFKNKCWPNLRTFLYAKGPVYLTHVAKEPKVSEGV
jgi:hypothetical protein